MSKLGWLLVGVGIGALATVQLRENPKAQEALDDAVSSAQEFGAAVAEGFKQREAELSKARTKKTPNT